MVGRAGVGHGQARLGKVRCGWVGYGVVRSVVAGNGEARLREILMSTAYVRGRAFEYRVRRHLESCGYLVIRSAQSKGIADLVAVKRKPRSNTAVLLVQCKLSKGSCGHAEWNALLQAAVDHGALPILADQVRSRSPLRYREILCGKSPSKGRYDGLCREIQP